MFFLMGTSIEDYQPDTVYTVLGLATVFLAVFMLRFAAANGRIPILWFFVGLYLSFFGLLLMLWVMKEDEKAGVTKEAYEYLCRGDWYSWGKVTMGDPVTGTLMSRERIVFGRKEEEIYRFVLNTGTYELMETRKYSAAIKDGQCIVTFPEDANIYYAGEDDLLHCFFRNDVDGEWLYSGTGSLKLDRQEKCR